MNSGDLDRRVSLQSVTVSRDAYGAAIETWASFSTVWASLEPLSGGETFASENILTQSTHIIEMRYRSDLTTEDRLVYNDWVYDIRYVAEIGRREGLRVLARWTGEQVLAGTADDPFTTFGDVAFATFGDDALVTM